MPQALIQQLQSARDQAHEARRWAVALREGARALQGESAQRRRRGRLALVETDARTLTRELAAVESVLEAWDGRHPPPDALTARVQEVELRLRALEEELRQLRPRARGSPQPDS